jgi:hypothetical protein
MKHLEHTTRRSKARSQGGTMAYEVCVVCLCVVRL